MNEKNAENADNFECKICKFKCSKKSNYLKHLTTLKHINRTKLNDLEIKNAKKCQEYICKYCNKIYNARNSLWYHEKKCEKSTEPTDIIENNEFELNKDMFMMLLKEHTELKSMLFKVLENGTHNTTTTNSHNKTFNLQVFLNETCKNAMNISDFLNTIELDLSDLEDVGEMGYVDGISNIIINNLKKLDITTRPIHCTDVKREILYVKDKDKWEKENEYNERMMTFVRDVANKNIKLLSVFKNKYPDCGKYESRYSDQYNKMVLEAMGGTIDNMINHRKIIKKVSKMVTIDKDIKNL